MLLYPTFLAAADRPLFTRDVGPALRRAARDRFLASNTFSNVCKVARVHILVFLGSN